jgi:SAM-dependent methyltransferase
MLRAHDGAVEMNNRNILRLLEPHPHGRFLDLGCNDGLWTMRVAEVLRTSKVYGIDLYKASFRDALKRGVLFVLADLNRTLPFQDDSMDIIHSNQVIEHLIDTDTFVQEIFRVLRPGGYAIISTENLSSIDNLLAMAVGQQAFSQHISSRIHVGNRFSPHYGQRHAERLSVHRTIFSYYGLAQFLQSYNFIVEAEVGAGYPPFPAFFSRIDSLHSRFITIKARKAEQGR